MNILSITTLLFFYLNSASAKEAPTPSATNFTVRYGSSPWNKSSTEIDSAFMFMRDQKSGQIVKIVLDETEPDSSLFSGRFSVNWSTQENVAPAVYIPPQNLRNDAGAIERFNSLLSNNKIKPQPLIMKTDKASHILEVYDTAEQAGRAKDAYKKELAALKNEEQAKLVKPQPDETALKVAKMAAQAAALALLAKQAAIQESDRIRLEQLELQKREARQKEQDQMATAEREARQTKAKSLAQKAIEYYKKNEYKESADLFEQAAALDPNNKEYYFMYGVSLYRLEQFNKALVTLKIAEGSQETELEKKYYIGLIHFRLKELSAARTAFGEVKAANHATLSPSAGFYEGLVHFSEENLEKAQASFEYVLDTSKEPALDKKAEEYIEKIAKLIQYKKMSEKKIFLTADFGLNYDSNILFAPDNDSSTATTTEKGGLRANLGGAAEYRFFYKETSEFSTKAAVTKTHSFSTDFVQADPLVYSLTAPYALKGLLNGKGARLTLTPGYEFLFMDYDRSEQLTNILNTIMINSDLLLVMKEDWFSNYTIDIRSDDSLLPGTTGTDSDADAIKVGFTKSETLFLDSAKKTALIGSLGYVTNSAKGDEKKYDRFEFGAIYTAPWLRFKNTTWNTGLNAYLQNYGSSDASRKDTNIALSVGTTRVINEEWSWTNSASYTNNSSSETASDYSKYSLLSSVHYAWSK